ncbi:hypothetical protein NSA47_07275 [Irregularibacter muris]|uniref:Uncharacterized protein n=1 Tax=Irregularibacter muris TaxID=1796619 RepID=A0AAE3HGR4_9FIRM|nr:hypothetical protein [Irregularibacter muris]MCR1898783.1 hypothetical protein [Irregularibacter muris]
MENTNSLLDACSDYNMEELEKLTFTKIVRGSGENEEFIGLGIMDDNGYLLEYEELKKIYSGLNYFIRKINPELIEKMNQQKLIEDRKQKEKDEIIEIVSKNIVDKEDWEEEEEEYESFFKRLFKRKNRR